MYCWGNAVVILLRCCCTVDVMLVLCCIIVGVLFPMRCCTMHALPALRWCVVYTLLPCAVDTLLIRCWCTHDMLLVYHVWIFVMCRWLVVCIALLGCYCNIGVIHVYRWCVIGVHILQLMFYVYTRDVMLDMLLMTCYCAIFVILILYCRCFVVLLL